MDSVKNAFNCFDWKSIDKKRVILCNLRLIAISIFSAYVVHYDVKYLNVIGSLFYSISKIFSPIFTACVLPVFFRTILRIFGYNLKLPNVFEKTLNWISKEVYGLPETFIYEGLCYSRILN